MTLYDNKTDILHNLESHVHRYLVPFQDDVVIMIIDNLLIEYLSCANDGIT